jgi:hypothetical protein
VAPDGTGDTDRRAALARDWDTLLDQVRALDGFGGFLRPLGAAQLRAATAGGTAVVLNVSGFRCDALVVTPDRISVVPLPDLTFDVLTEATNTCLLALQAIGLVRTLPLRVRAEGTVTDLLAWLWDVIADPVLDALGITGPPAPGGRWPRVWWCPTGPLTMLPIHAAGHPQPGRCVLDRVISSYLPTLGALVRARHAGPAPGTGGLLTVAMPETRDRRPLPSARQEAARVAAGFLGPVPAHRAVTLRERDDQ